MKLTSKGFLRLAIVGAVAVAPVVGATAAGTKATYKIHQDLQTLVGSDADLGKIGFYLSASSSADLKALLLNAASVKYHLTSAELQIKEPTISHEFTSATVIPTANSLRYRGEVTLHFQFVQLNKPLDEIITAANNDLGNVGYNPHFNNRDQLKNAILANLANTYGLDKTAINIIPAGGDDDFTLTMTEVSVVPAAGTNQYIGSAEVHFNFIEKNNLAGAHAFEIPLQTADPKKTLGDWDKTILDLFNKANPRFNLAPGATVAYYAADDLSEPLPSTEPQGRWENVYVRITASDDDTHWMDSSEFIKLLQFSELIPYSVTNNIFNAITDANGVIWMPAMTGIFSYTPGQPAPTAPAIPYATTGPVYSVDIGPDGTVWVGTSQHGLFAYTPGQPAPTTPVMNTYHMDDNNNKIYETYYGIKVDQKTGTVFVYSDSGLYVYTPGQPAPTTPVISGDLVRPRSFANMKIDSSTGTVWIASSYGVFAYTPGQPAPTSPVIDFNITDLVNDFQIDESTGTVWIAAGNGLFYYTPGQPIPTESVIPKDQIQFVRDVQIDPATGTIWAVASKGLFSYHPGQNPEYKQWIEETFNYSGISGPARSMMEIFNGTVWVATSKGLYAYTPGQPAQTKPAKPVISTSMTGCAVDDKDGSLLIFSGNSSYKIK